MKRYFIFALAVSFMAVSCQKEVGAPESESNSSNCFVARISDESKVTIDSDWHLAWEAGDKVKVTDGTNVAEITAQTAGKETTFNCEFEIDPVKDYPGIYPSSAALFEGGDAYVTIPSMMVPEAGKYPVAPAVGIANGTEKIFNFKNVCGLVSFTISDDDIASVTIYGKNYVENVAGKVSVDCSDASYSVVEGEKYVTLQAAEAFATGRYYVAVLPQNFEEGMSITLHKTDGSKVRRNFAAFVLGRSQHVDLEDLASGKEFKSEFTIKNAAELQAFLSIASNCTASTTATLAGDIDMTGIVITPATSYAGTFDGANYSLKNWTSNGALFTEVAAGATVKDVVLDESCTLTIAPANGSYASVAYIAITNHGTVSGCKNYAAVTCKPECAPETIRFGTIVAYNDGTVSECENHGNITLDLNGEMNSTKSRFAGVVGCCAGTAAADSLVLKCKNTGAITMNCTGTASAFSIAVGGVVSVLATGGNPVSSGFKNLGGIRNCVNEGAITINASGSGMTPSNLDLGGVLGYAEGNASYCQNTAAVSLITSEGSYTKGRPAVGGVAGYVIGADYCNNTGDVTVKGNFSSAKSVTAFTGPTTDLTNPSVGGVVGCAGLAAKDDNQISRSTNSGKVLATLDMDSSASYSAIIGGVIGSTTAKAVYCTNDGEVEVQSQFNSTLVGGVIGRENNRVYSCINNGAVKLDLVNTATNGNKSLQCYLGGVLGFNKNAGSSDDTEKLKDVRLNTNNGSITLLNGVYDSSKTSYIGGLIGGTQAVTIGANDGKNSNINNGKLTINTPMNVWAGGALGRFTTDTSNKDKTQHIQNFGDIVVNNAGPASVIGGLIAFHRNGTVGYNAYVGKSDKYVSITVDTPNNAGIIVGGLIGKIENSVATTNPSFTITGYSKGSTSYITGQYVNITAQNATAGIIAGNITFSNSKSSRTIAYSSLLRSGASCSLNGTTCNITTAEDGDVLKYYGSFDDKGAPTFSAGSFNSGWTAD